MNEADSKFRMSAKARARLSQRERTFADGESLFVEAGEPGHMFILLSGTLAVESRGVSLGTIEEPGTYVGEMSALLDEPRSATVTARGSTRVLEIPKTEIFEFLSHAPSLVLKLGRILAERLKKTSNDFQSYRIEMDRRFKDLSNRFHELYDLSRGTAPSDRVEMAGKFNETLSFLAALPALDADKRTRYVH